MSSGNSANARRGFGARGVQPHKASSVKVKPERRIPTYAELSVPGPDEVPSPSQRTIWKDAELLWLRAKWQIVLCGIVSLLYLLQGAFSSGVERVGKEGVKGLGRDLRTLASQCADPAARRRLQDAGWTVRTTADGGCRISAPLD